MKEISEQRSFIEQSIISEVLSNNDFAAKKDLEETTGQTNWQGIDQNC